MRQFIIKRLLWAVMILFLVAFVIYLLMRALPTSYVEAIARERAAAQTGMSYKQWLDQLTALYRLDVHPIIGFFHWLGNAVRGQFGTSWHWGVDVVEKFRDVVPASIILGAAAFVLEIVIAIPLGILAARKQYSLTDYTVTFVALIGISLPTFFVATILKMVFAVNLGWLDLYGMVSRDHRRMTEIQKILDIASHMIMPVLTIVVISVGSLMRYTRTNMLEVLNADYIRTARAKGLSERRVINYHAFRNTLIPIVTIVGGTLPSLFSGALITEQLFQIPGIGWISYISMTRGDIPFTMFYLSFMAILTMLGNLISDILYAVVDPRVRVS